MPPGQAGSPLHALLHCMAVLRLLSQEPIGDEPAEGKSWSGTTHSPVFCSLVGGHSRRLPAPAHPSSPAAWPTPVPPTRPPDTSVVCPAPFTYKQQGRPHRSLTQSPPPAALQKPPSTALQPTLTNHSPASSPACSCYEAAQRQKVDKHRLENRQDGPRYAVAEPAQRQQTPNALAPWHRAAAWVHAQKWVQLAAPAAACCSKSCCTAVRPATPYSHQAVHH